MPHSKLKEAVARLLSANNFVGNVDVTAGTIGKQLVIAVANTKGQLAITEIARLSKPGRRLYANADAIPSVKGGRGIVIISTSSGVMTGADAKKQRLGGELLCQVF